MLIVWMLVFVMMLVVLALVMVPAGLLGAVSLLLRGVPSEGDGDLAELVWMLPGVCAIMATMMAALCLWQRHVFHAEFDLTAGTFLLREARFPNRRREVTLPLTAIVGIHARHRAHDGPTDVQLLLRERGRERETTVGNALDAGIIEAHLALLRTHLGERVQSAELFDP